MDDSASTFSRPTPHGFDIAATEKYRRAANYLAAAQIYLQDNALPEEPLKSDHIKSCLPRHRGTGPGISLIYAHLNASILRIGASVLLITGPGHYDLTTPSP